jgi:S1-C subfamily serine protease
MNEQAGSSGVQVPQATPTWMWGLVGAIVLLAGFGGGMAGFQLGRQDQSTTTCTYQQTYWLLGASLADRDGKVVVEDIARGGPAASAGLVNGDELAAIDNRAINNAQEAQRIIQADGAGVSVVLTIERDSIFTQYSILLGGIWPGPVPVEPPIIIISPPQPQPPDTYGEPSLGVYYKMIQPGDPFGVRNGALLIMIWEGSSAEAAGLEPGDIVLSVNDTALSTSYTLEDALRDAGSRTIARLRVRDTDGSTRSIRVVLGTSYDK